jgi:FXSXX-COOH protein
MKEMEKDSQPVRSSVPDVAGVPLSNVRALFANEVTAVVRRMVDDAQLPAKPPVAAFSSCILA